MSPSFSASARAISSYLKSGMRLAEIHVYPLKGARGIALPHADVCASGLRHDRRFMLVDEEGQFLTQREHARLALITTAIHEDSLQLGIGDTLTEIELAPKGRRTRVRVWDDETDAVEVPGPSASLLSSYLGVSCRLVFMPDDVVRPVDPRYARSGDKVGFADGFPVLLASLSSLSDLNSRLPIPVPMNRFRANFVVEGGDAFEEDAHTHVRIGALAFRMPKRCSRCQVVTVDQGNATVGKEPLKTLASYRSDANKVYFAQNLIPDAEGKVRVGDAVRYA
jgi:uncharacterized protein YcbX